jgi:hypothetical protein
LVGYQKALFEGLKVRFGVVKDADNIGMWLTNQRNAVKVDVWDTIEELEQLMPAGKIGKPLWRPYKEALAEVGMQL